MANKLRTGKSKKTTSVSTATIFKKAVAQKLVKEAKRQEEEGRRKFAIEKRKRRAEEALKLKAKATQENPLLGDMSSQLVQSRLRIQEECEADVDTAKTQLLGHLLQPNEQQSQADQHIHIAAQQLSAPCDSERIEWHFAGSQHSGITDLDTLMKSLSREVIAAEKKIVHHHAESVDVNANLLEQASDIVQHNSSSPRDAVEDTFGLRLSEEEKQAMKQEISDERKRTMALVDQENKIAVKALNNADQIFNDRCKELDDMQHSLLAVLADDEY